MGLEEWPSGSRRRFQAASAARRSEVRILLPPQLRFCPRFGQTALHYAAARHSGLNDADRARFASMLIDFGARVDLRDDLLKSTPLGWACRWGREEMAELLIARGAQVEEPDAEPWATPKAWAKKMKHETISALLRRYSLRDS